MTRSELIGLLHTSAQALNTLEKSGAAEDANVGTAVKQVQDHLLDVVLQMHGAILLQQSAPPAAKPCGCAKAKPSVEAEAVRPLVTGDSVTYGYDTLGRLTTLTYANGTVIQYNYDSVGNRTSVVTTCGGSGC